MATKIEIERGKITSIAQLSDLELVHHERQRAVRHEQLQPELERVGRHRHRHARVPAAAA